MQVQVGETRRTISLVISDMTLDELNGLDMCIAAGIREGKPSTTERAAGNEVRGLIESAREALDFSPDE